MKIALQIPDAVLRRASREAKRRRISVPQLIAEALLEKLGPEPLTPAQSRAARREFAGALSHLKAETARINAIIEEEFQRD